MLSCPARLPSRSTFHLFVLKQKSLKCASVGGLSRNPDQRSPTVTPVLLLRCCVFICCNPENNTHRTCKFAFSPWSNYLTRLWSWRPISREGAHPFNWGRTLLVQLGGVFFDKTLAEGPSAAPVRFCFMAHGSHRFIVCSVQVSPRGPHCKQCATSRGPPCKQGATIATLHCVCRLCGTNSRPPVHHTTSSFHHMRLPLTRNQLPTTSTPPSRFHEQR